jgi:hypothetical protein
VSNWGGYALAAAVCALCDRIDVLSDLNTAHERKMLEHLVGQSGAVDGVTRRAEPTVDGLAFDDYIRPLVEIRVRLGLAR